MDFKFPSQQPGQPDPNQAQQFPVAQTLSFRDDQKDDLIRFQLDLSKTKSDIRHWLRGDEPIVKDGKEDWSVNKNTKYQVLNDFGIREVMRIINMYLTKDVIMGSISEPMINRMTQDIAYELNGLFFSKHDEIGLDTPSKKKNYTTILVPIMHIIYITLGRAKDGEERKGITETRNIIESYVNTPQSGVKIPLLGRRFK